MKRYFLFIITLFVAALNFNLILKPFNLVTGGTQGLSLLICSFIGFTPSITIFIINIITLIFSYFLLSKDITYSTILASFIYPFFVFITSFISKSFILSNSLFISSFIAGVVCGMTGGYIYLLGFSAGGINTINLLVNRYFKIKVAYSNFIINAIIIVLGGIFFGLKKALYSLIIIFISSIIINYLLCKKRKLY